jgi:hypothetical protein
MDNQATKYIKQFLTKKECNLQVVEPHNHRVNPAEHAIRMFKDAFIAALATTDHEFPLQLWDKLAPQVQDTLNLLRTSRINPNVSAYDALNGPYNWDCHLPSWMQSGHLQSPGSMRILGVKRYRCMVSRTIGGPLPMQHILCP